MYKCTVHVSVLLSEKDPFQWLQNVDAYYPKHYNMITSLYKYRIGYIILLIAATIIILAIPTRSIKISKFKQNEFRSGEWKLVPAKCSNVP